MITGAADGCRATAVSSVRAVFELDRSLPRVGLSGRPGVVDVHRAHITSIPFENLDPHGGVPVSVVEVSNWFTSMTREAVPDLLAERFGLDGFTLGEGNRIVRAAGG